MEGNPKRCLVFVNPVSGSGQAVKIWNTEVKLMLKDAQTQYTCIITEKADHAKEFMMTVDASAFDVVLAIGGDGLFYEVIQGLSTRPDSMFILSKLPLAAIPGGTGNGLAKTVLFEVNESFSSLNATYIALKGRPRPMDLSMVILTFSAKVPRFISFYFHIRLQRNQVYTTHSSASRGVWSRT